MMDERTILITGATGKLGSQLALGFASQGARLVLPVRTPDKAKVLQNKLFEAGASEVLLLPMDLTSEHSALELCAELARQEVFPEVLINNARNIEYLKPDENGHMSRTQWMGEFLLDVVVPYEFTTQLALQSGAKLKKVINVASIYGVVAPNLALYEDAKQSPINYGVAKAALIHLTKELAVRLAPKITVNAVSYGGVSGRVDEGFKQRYASLCPSGQMLLDEDVFGAIKFLSSKDAAGMTGHNLIVDGGWAAW